jgi:non-heme chloroperoxidase
MPARHMVNAVLVAVLAAPPAADRLQTVRVNHVTLHYVERGTGEPIAFVHGALVDYREWGPVAEQLSDKYRTIVYSRRYNFPNDNRRPANNHSAAVEAADLAALNRHLRLGPMHVVGVSYGAYTALLLALREPQMIRTLTLVEPPLIKWLADLPGGPALFDQFYRGTWQAAGRAFTRGDATTAMRISLDFFVGPGGFDRLSAEARADVMRNVREWQALTTSRDAYPAVRRDQIRSLRMPVLMISGGKTYPMLHLIDGGLERQLRNGRRLVVPDGTHDVCSEQPLVCADAIRAFLGGGTPSAARP